MKSMSRGCAEPAAVTRTMLSPQRMTTEPPACFAHFPVSTMISLPPITAVSRTYGIRVLSAVHVARPGSWPGPSVQILDRFEELDGTIKPARPKCETTYPNFGGFRGRVWHRPDRKESHSG